MLADRYLTGAQVSRKTGLQTYQLTYLRQKSRIPWERIGRSVLYPRPQIDQWIADFLKKIKK